MLFFILALLFSYLIGSVSFAIILSRVYNLSDPRTYGSSNAGATNILRSGNKKAAILTLIGDCLKGATVVWLARLFFGGINGGESLVALCGIMVILGHIYPIFFKFKGGKGVATAIGVLLGFNVWLALLCLGSWIIVFAISRISSLSAIVAAMTAPIFAYLLMKNNVYFGATLVIAFFILYTHKLNILRLLTGQEHVFKKKQGTLNDKK
jgi:glycerol-3-phosphate acyltransferase PlsY